MSAVRISMMALVLLAGCDGNPLASAGGGGGVTGGSSGVPAAVARNMNAMSYAGGVLKIDMQGVTSSAKLATFVRDTALDVPSSTGNPAYAAYIYQETGLTRSYLAYVAENARGNLLAVSSMDGGQFNQVNMGGRYVQVTAYTAPALGTGPEQGLFSYSGSYVGIFTPGDTAKGPNSQPVDLKPGEPFYTVGTAQINGDFGHGTVEGGVADRQLFAQDGTPITSITVSKGGIPTTYDTSTLAAITLRQTAIDSKGYFLGDVEFTGASGGKVGDYGGAFGGAGATDVAGVLWLNPIKGENGIWEQGTFNLPRCDLPGNSPLCTPR